MNPRVGLVLGAVMAAFAGSVLAFAPPTWLAGLLDVSGDAATSFLVRRYGASATIALLVVCIAVLRGSAAQRAALFGLATWFAVQGTVAIFGIVTGAVGEFAWAALGADPVLACWFLALSRRA